MRSALPHCGRVLDHYFQFKIFGVSNSLSACNTPVVHDPGHLIHTKSGGKLRKNQALLPLVFLFLPKPFWDPKCNFIEFVKKAIFSYVFWKLVVVGFIFYSHKKNKFTFWQLFGSWYNTPEYTITLKFASLIFQLNNSSYWTRWFPIRKP